MKGFECGNELGSLTGELNQTTVGCHYIKKRIAYGEASKSVNLLAADGWSIHHRSCRTHWNSRQISTSLELEPKRWVFLAGESVVPLSLCRCLEQHTSKKPTTADSLLSLQWPIAWRTKCQRGHNRKGLGDDQWHMNSTTNIYQVLLLMKIIHCKAYKFTWISLIYICTTYS